MKIGLHSPYVPTHVGGGEKYFFDIARTAADLGHEVSILLESQMVSTDKYLDEVRLRYESFLGISLKGITFVHSPLGESGSFWQKLWFTKKFDILYLITDGSLFFSLADKNIVHIQIPFTQPKKTFFDRLKLLNWQIKNTNSLFTKKIVEKSWETPIQFVHYPMVDLPKTDSSAKQKIILNVGRFFDHLHSKRQDVLVESFIQILKNEPSLMKDWKLILVGPAEDKVFAEKIKTMAKGYPIEILHNLTRQQLLEQYQKATLYWHAAGYEINETTSPEKVEHFGISTVEAMHFGCVPLVVGKGGQIEVLGESLEGLLWQSKADLTELTIRIIKNSSEQKKLALLAMSQSKKFNKTSFEKKFLEMIT